MRWAWVSLHRARAVNKYICHCGDSRELVTEACGHRHVRQRDRNLVTPPGCYGGQGGIHKQVPAPANEGSIVSVPWESHQWRAHPSQPLPHLSLLLIPSLPSLIAIDSILLALFYLLLLSLPSPSHPNRGRSRNITVRGTALLPFLCGSARSVWKPPPLSPTHPELGVQQKSPTERDRNPPYIPNSRCSRLGYRSCLVLESWLSCCGGERLGLLPNSRSLSRESRRVCLSSPLHPSHIHALSHTLAHTLAMLLLLLLLLCSVAPLPFDGSLTFTHHKPSMCILAVCIGTYTDSPLCSR